MKSFTAFALEDLPLVKPRDNIARIVLEVAERNGLKIEEGDVIAIAQKIFSKAEERVRSLKEVAPSNEAEKIARITRKSAKFVELVLRETRNVLKASRDLLLVEDRRGLVCINAGIDKSNVEGRGNFALLPEDPDRSAERCREEITRLTGKNVAVIICDTFSRPFRRGQVNFAIGVSGIKPFKDYRGEKDLFGYVLKVRILLWLTKSPRRQSCSWGKLERADPLSSSEA